MSEVMTLRVISPSEVVYEGTVVMVGFPGTQGAFTVLYNHASLITTLEKGRIVYRTEDNGEDQTIEITGGLATIDRNVVSVCLQ